jgi:hypothetical protein
MRVKAGMTLMVQGRKANGCGWRGMKEWGSIVIGRGNPNAR